MFRDRLTVDGRLIRIHGLANEKIRVRITQGNAVASTATFDRTGDDQLEFTQRVFPPMVSRDELAGGITHSKPSRFVPQQLQDTPVDGRGRVCNDKVVLVSPGNSIGGFTGQNDGFGCCHRFEDLVLQTPGDAHGCNTDVDVL